MTEDSGFTQEDFVGLQETLYAYAAKGLESYLNATLCNHLSVVLAALDIAARQSSAPPPPQPEWFNLKPGTLKLPGTGITIVHNGGGCFLVHWNDKALPHNPVSLESAKEIALRHYAAMREVGLETDPQT
jgi:hypothetical protein